MKTPAFIIALSCAAAALASTEAGPPVEEPLPDELLAGEVLALETSSEGSAASGRMQILMQAPPPDIWAVIVSCGKAFAFVDGLKFCEVLEDSGDRALVHQVVDKGWAVPKQDFVFESLRRPWSEIDFRLVEGNLKTMEGSWLFRETPAGTLVDYTVRIRPGVPAPKFMVRRSVTKGMPDLLACIRGLAGGSGGEKASRSDLARCPGKERKDA